MLTISSIRKDIEELNQLVLLFMADPQYSQSSKRYLGVHSIVCTRLQDATPDDCRSAISCGVPLVKLSAQAAVDLADPDKLKIPTRSFKDDLPALLKEINILTLYIAQRTTLMNPHIAVLFFGLVKPQLEVVSGACMSDIRIYANRCGNVVELRGASAPNLWDLIMIGGRIDGPRGSRLSHDAALMSLQ